MEARPESCTAPVAAMLAERTTSLPGALILLSKPGIVLAETAAGFAGILLACNGRVQAATTLFWALAVLVMAASGSAMGNCVLDAEADQWMPRLASRNQALAAVGKGRVLAFSLLLTGAALTLSALFLNNLALLLLLAAICSYLFLYTIWLKPRSHWGVLAGAIPGALPPLIGAAAVTGSVPALPLLLAAFIFIWQIPHFLFLALLYRDQYRQAGVPVLPLTRGEPFTKALALTAALLLLPLSLLFALSGVLSPGYLTLACIAWGFFMLTSIRCLYQTNAYRSGFIASTLYLLTLIAAICAGSVPELASFKCW